MREFAATMAGKYGHFRDVTGAIAQVIARTTAIPFHFEPGHRLENSAALVVVFARHPLTDEPTEKLDGALRHMLT